MTFLFIRGPKNSMKPIYLQNTARAIAILMLMCFFSIHTSWAASHSNPKGMEVVVTDAKGKHVGLYSGSYALVIGVSSYKHWPKLNSVTSEINAVEAALNKNGFTVYKVLNPTSNQLYSAFKHFIDTYGLDRDNRLLFFFSGHGYSRRNGRKGYLVPVDAPDPGDNEKEFVRRSLDMGQIISWSRRVEAKHALFAFDSCFSGTIFKVKSASEAPGYISERTMRPVRQFITAGGAGESVPERSIFTPLFIRAIEGAADFDHDGYVTGTELGYYLEKKVISYNNGQHPQCGKIKDPDLDEGDYVFVLRDSATKTFLSVKSDVSGAKVYVDDICIGKTNLLDMAVSPGKHQIRIIKDGYATYMKEISLKNGQEEIVYAELMPNDSQRFYNKLGAAAGHVTLKNLEDLSYLMLGVGYKRLFYKGYVDVMLMTSSGSDHELVISSGPPVTFGNASYLSLGYAYPLFQFNEAVRVLVGAGFETLNIPSKIDGESETISKRSAYIDMGIEHETNRMFIEAKGRAILGEDDSLGYDFGLLLKTGMKF